MLRKVFTAGIMMMAIFSMTVVVSPASAATLNNGDLVMLSKSANPSGTVFYFNDGKLYTFPHEAVYKTWYTDWSGIKTITSTELNAYARAGNVTVRPGTKLLKTPTTNDVYAVEPNGVLRSIVSEANAIALWGTNWNKNVIDQADSVVWGTYTTGAALTAGKYPVGSIVNPKGSMDIFYYDGTNFRKFTNEATLLQNKYTFDNIVTTTMAVTAGGTAITGAESALITVSGSAVATTPTTNPDAGSGLTVALSSTTPASAVLPDGATGVVMAKLNLTASADGPVVIQSLSTYRNGIGTPSNIAKVHLYEGDMRLTSSGKTVNSTTNKSIFTNLDYTIPAGTTKTISIVADILATATDNHSLGIMAAADITTDGATVSGSFPVMGNVMSVSNVDIGTATTDLSGSTTYVRKIGEKEAIVGKFSIATTLEDSKLHRVAIYNNGTDILNNMTLWRGGTKLASGVEGDRYFTFTLDTPNAIIKGESITYTLKADVYSVNVTNTADLYIKDDADLLVIGDTYGYGVDVDNALFDGGTSEKTTVTLEAGDITIISTGPSATDVAVDKNDITLMDFSITALNDTTVETTSFLLTDTGGLVTGSATTQEVSDAELYCDGIGLISSTNLIASPMTWTDNFDLEAGKTYNCLVRIDVESIADGAETIYATLNIDIWDFRDANTDTAFDTTSTTYNIVPSADQVGYTMTVKSATLAVAAATSPASQTWVRGGQAIETAGYTFTAGDADDAVVQDITFDACYGTGTSVGKCGSRTGNSANSAILSVSLWDGATQVGTSKSIDSSGQIAFTDLAWVIPASSTKTLTVKSNYNTSLPGSVTAYVSIGMQLDAITAYYDDGNKTMSDTMISGNDSAINASAVDGDHTFTGGVYQTVLNNGTLAMDIPGTTPSSDIAVAGTANVKFSEVKLTATREDFAISKMAFRNANSGTTGDYDDNVAKVWVKYPTNGAQTTTETKECTLASGVVTCSGLNVWVPNPDVTGNKKYAIVEVLVDTATKAAGADAADAPEFIPYLGADWEAIGRSSGQKLYEADTATASITITDVTGAGTDTTETLATDEWETTTETEIIATNTVVGNIVVGDIICADTGAATACETDKAFVTAISTTTMTVVRGVNGTTPTAIAAAAGDNDGILKFANIMTDVNPMNVQGTKLTVANQLATKTGGQSTTEKVMEFTVTPNVLGDATIRKGDQNPATAATSDFYTTGLAGTFAEIDGTDITLSTVTTTEAEGTAFQRITEDLTGTTEGIMYTFATVDQDLSAYKGIAFWVRSSAASTNPSATGTPAWTFTTVETTGATNSNTFYVGTADMWQLVELDFSATTTDQDLVDSWQIISANNLANSQTFDLDNIILYKEKITVDLTLNAASTARDGSTAYLKQNGTIVAVGNVTWQDASTAAHSGAVVFVPYNTYNDIQISGTDTFTVEIDTTGFVNGTSTENITAAIVLGSSGVTPSAGSTNNFYWYDDEFSDNVPYVGINTTDQISTSITY